MLIDHTLWDGVVDKVQVAIERIRQFEPPEGYYLAFSGGKDSCVVLDLVKRSGVKYDAHYNLTTVDPPELVHFIRREHPEVAVHRPKESMWQLIARKGDLPTRNARWCCSILKEGGGAGRTVITGVRWAESARRSKRRMIEICNQQAGKNYLHPIIDWSHDEVWEYIHANKIPYCSLYDEGFKRIGCILCPMTRKAAQEAERWPKIFAMYQFACEKGFPVMKERKERKNGKPITWKNAREWFEWWAFERDGKEKEDPDQTVMFE